MRCSAQMVYSQMDFVSFELTWLSTYGKPPLVCVYINAFQLLSNNNSRYICPIYFPFSLRLYSPIDIDGTGGTKIRKKAEEAEAAAADRNRLKKY